SPAYGRRFAIECPARLTTWNFSPFGEQASKIPDSPWSSSAKSYPVAVSLILNIVFTFFLFLISSSAPSFEPFNRDFRNRTRLARVNRGEAKNYSQGRRGSGVKKSIQVSLLRRRNRRERREKFFLCRFP